MLFYIIYVMNIAFELTTFIFDKNKQTNFTFTQYLHVNCIWLNNRSGRVQFSVIQNARVIRFKFQGLLKESKG